MIIYHNSVILWTWQKSIEIGFKNCQAGGQFVYLHVCTYTVMHISSGKLTAVTRVGTFPSFE